MSDHRWGTREDAVWWPSEQNREDCRSPAALFPYKVPNFPPSSCASASPSCMRGYENDYRGVMRPDNSAAAVAAATGWWYPGMQGGLPNVPAPVVQSRGRMPRAKADAKPRGRMTAYAFFVQTCREEHKKKHPDENVVFAEFSKKCAERWKTMSDKEKKRFHEMAEKDKKRYDLEMKDYIPPTGEKHGKKRKHIKDPNAPKRSLSAFFWFCNDERSKVKGANPEFGIGDIAKELGKKWSDAEPETKSKYEAMAEKDKARYDREMTAYKKKPKAGIPIPVKVPPPRKPDSDEDEEEEEQEDGDEEDEDIDEDDDE